METYRGYTIEKVLHGTGFGWFNDDTYDAEFDGEGWITPADSGYFETAAECKTAIDEYLD